MLNFEGVATGGGTITYPIDSRSSAEASQLRKDELMAPWANLVGGNSMGNSDVFALKTENTSGI